MDFDFTDDQHAFRDSLRGYLARYYPGPSPKSPRPVDEQHQQLWSGLAELGLLSISAPTKAGGLGLSFLDLTLPLEELGRVAAPPLLIDTLIATEALAGASDDGRVTSILEEIKAGSIKVAIALFEPDVADGPDTSTTTATRRADGFLLQGTKFLVAEAPRADYILVVCKSEQLRPAVAVVPAERVRSKCRLHHSLDVTANYYELTLDNLLPQEQLIFCSSAQALQDRLFEAGALATALQATGIAARMLETTLDYLKQRTQFGKLIGSFQALKHRCADLAVALGSSRSAAYYASWALAHRSSERLRAVSIAKAYCCDTARRICNETIQMHGGMGFTWDQGTHLFLRRNKMLEILYGDAAYHNGRIIDITTHDLLQVSGG